MTEHAAAADLAATLRLCEAGRLRCSDKTKRPTAATVQLVAESLAAGELYLGVHGPVASFAWPLLLQAGGLAELAGTRMQLTSRGRAALEAPAHETLRDLWRRWLKHALLDEFNRVDQIKGQASRGALTAGGPRRVFETPLAVDRYKQASTELLAMLHRIVYPALRDDPANEAGQYPIRFRPGGFTFEVETPGGGLHYLVYQVYQVIEELGRVLVLDLVTFREP